LVFQIYGARYPAVRTPGNTLWPLKLVTQLFKLAQNASSAVSLKLHTHTPVTAVRQSPTNGDAHRWRLETLRGPVICTHVVHATNAYAPALLPQLEGLSGIVPTRGQAISIRAGVPARGLSLSGFTANHGKEYWFVRPGSSPDERPLIIFGGARLAEGSSQNATTDDSVLDPAVGRRLRTFLPEVFPGKFEKGAEPEMEWVRPTAPASSVDRSLWGLIVCYNRQASWALPNTGIRLCVSAILPYRAIIFICFFLLPLSQVGPVLDKFKPGGVPYEGQYIAAGFSGHGMPRAFGWFVYSFLPVFPR
jgi:hypothetical protein